ncbi:MAG: Nif3-like dinuclear metal center hexameric protein [Tindallia sp. MSAO_Bac2]|nr:MAG: Nif3-like dinuclear metal center hexameric protein [Tindallia sp. MSAO_Bac2]
MAPKVKDIIQIFEKKASETLAMDWDQIGLQIGSMDDEVKTVFVTLDLTMETLEEAVQKNAQLIITHHPFIFDPVRKIRTDQTKGFIIAQLLRKNISLYVAHTNVDIALGGLNDWASDLLKLKNITLLQETGEDSLEKLVVFIPAEYATKVSNAIMDAGAGHIGEYSHCGYYLKGTGTFKPLAGATPFIGSENRLETVEEVRLETVMHSSKRSQVLKSMIEAHPYEEVAYDIYPLKNNGHRNGIGRIGDLPEGQTPEIFIQILKEAFSIQHVRWTPGSAEYIVKVGVLTGSGASAINAAVMKGCDCLVTGDIKYHDAQLASEQGLHLFDIGHFESEITFVPLIVNQLKGQLENSGLNVDVIGATEQQKLIFTK